MSNMRDITIGDDRYETTLFTTSKSIKILRRLVKVIGPSMAALFENKDEFGLDDTGPITKAVSLLSDNIDKEDVVTLLQDILSNTTKNGKPINFDIDFMGQINTLFKVVVFVVKENYGGFFDQNAFAQS